VVSASTMVWMSAGSTSFMPPAIRLLISAVGEAAMTGIPRLMERLTSLA
jgi:hypothetical protein